MKETKILALDPATITGYYTQNEGGIWDFKLKSYESTGLKFISLYKALKSLYEKQDFNFLVYEKPSGQHFTGVRSHSNFEGVILLFCEDYDIDYKTYTSTEIKKFATGKGNAKKPDMIKACKEKYGIEPIDDNHADAIHLWHLATNQFI